MRTNAHSRRTVLRGIAGAAVGIAGCTGSPTSSDSTASIEDVTVDEWSIVVTLNSDSGIEQLNLISPKGSKEATAEVVSGETRVDFELATGYTPGTFRITSESGDEASIEIRPKVEILEVGVGANNIDRMPDSLENTQSDEALVVVKNKAKGPTSILNLLFRGDIPNPTEDIEESDSKSGIFDAEDGKGEIDEVALTGGEKTVLYSSTLPFSFAAEGEDCESMPNSGRFEIKLGLSTSENLYTTEYAVEYGKEGSSSDCNISIERSSE